MERDRDRPHAGDDAQFLASSGVRVALLSRLSGSPAEYGELRSCTDSSRASLSRNVTYLKGKGWVREADGELAITGAGELALRTYERFSRSMEAVDELEEFLDWVPVSGALRLDLGKLRGAEVVTPTRVQPMTPVKRLLDLLTGADRVRALLPGVLPSMKEEVVREMEDGMQMEVVLSASLGDLVRGDVAEVAERFDARFYALDEELPFGLRLIDDALTLLAHDDEGLPRALLVNDDPEAVRWGERLFEEARGRAEEL